MIHSVSDSNARVTTLSKTEKFLCRSCHQSHDYTEFRWLKREIDSNIYSCFLNGYDAGEEWDIRPRPSGKNINLIIVC